MANIRANSNKLDADLLASQLASYSQERLFDPESISLKRFQGRKGVLANDNHNNDTWKH